MKFKFREHRFGAAALEKIEQMIKIVDEYEDQGLVLTARQLYYQFVSRDLAPNTQRSYKNLTKLLADARYAGLIDWDAIEDRGRTPTSWRTHENIQECVDDALAGFALNPWKDQSRYVELWVEKQALAGVLEPLASEYTATLMVNKGYSSASAMFESAARFTRQNRDLKDCLLFYLGDHDPSGEDMVRDIGDRLQEFGARVYVEKIALTMEQVEKYSPPPNPAKTSDSRYAGYSAQHGDESWEVDALPPNVLQDLIRYSFDSVIKREAWDATKAAETAEKAKLSKMIARMK